MSSVANQIIENSNLTQQAQAQARAQASAQKTSSTSVSSFDFLKLLTEQLKYQDPTNPMDNTEMLAQEAQFATLEQMESLATGFNKFSTTYQANSLKNELVEITKQDGTKIKGYVDFVDLTDSNGASVSVNGSLYPLSQVTGVYPQQAAKDSLIYEKLDKITESNTTGQTLLESISDNISKITSKLSEYTKNNDTTQE